MSNINYETKMELLKDHMPEKYEELKSLEQTPKQIKNQQEKFDALLETPVKVEQKPVKRAITYIATATESFGGTLAVNILASNARTSEYFGNYRTVEQCEEAVKRLGQVTWVTPYRFSKEASC